MCCITWTVLRQVCASLAYLHVVHRGARQVSPVAGWVGSLDDHAFLVPVELGADGSGAEPERQAAAAAVRSVEARPVQQQVAVQRDLARLEFDIHLGAVHPDFFHRLIKHVVLGFLAQVVGQMPVVVRPGHETHAGVARVRVVDGQPGGDRLRR